MEMAYLSADEIYAETMCTLVPLECQERYARQLASLLSMHLKRSVLMECGFPAESLPSCSAIVVAGTGQGKTHILRQMVKSAGINLIVVDASTLAKETWKGATLGERLLAEKEASKDLNDFRRSVLFIDEIDKIRMNKNGSNAGNPMDNLLQLFESGVVTTEGNHHNAVSIDISQFTIICAGAFDGLESIIEQRIKPRASIGFMHTEKEETLSKAELMRMVKMEDLEAYGMMPEFLGRIGTILSIDPMGVEDYRQLLSSEKGSIRWKYANYLRAFFGIELEITDGAVQMIAEDCMNRGSGARAANAATQTWMQMALSIAEQDEMICKVVLDADESSCFLRYELGSRAYTCFSKKEMFSEPYVMKAENISELTKTLCEMYQKSDGDRLYLPGLKAFLNCSLYFLKNHTQEEEFTFASLEKFARQVHKRKGEINSTFDTVITTAIAYACDDSEGEKLKLYHRDFKDFESPWFAYHLIMALNQIMDEMISTYGTSVLKFEVECDE